MFLKTTEKLESTGTIINIIGLRVQKLWPKQNRNFAVFGTRQKKRIIATDTWRPLIG